MVKSSLGVNPRARLGPILDSTEGVSSTKGLTVYISIHISRL